MPEENKSLQWQRHFAIRIAIIAEKVVMVTRGVKSLLRSREQGSETLAEGCREGGEEGETGRKSKKSAGMSKERKMQWDREEKKSERERCREICALFLSL